MTEKDLENKIIEVITLLENEINTRTRGTGVYKKLLKTYKEALEECEKGLYEKVRIKGTMRYYYDCLAPKNELLESKMDEAIEAAEELQRKWV